MDKITTAEGGAYQIIAEIAEGDEGDERIKVYVGRHILGHCDLVAARDAPYWVWCNDQWQLIDGTYGWVVGRSYDPDINRDQWQTLEERCGKIDLEAVRRVDASLADRLAGRRREAYRYGCK